MLQLATEKRDHKVSVFTPSHNPQWLPDVYLSLCNQTLKDWEWVVLLNNDACRTELSFCSTDDRVHIFNDCAPTTNIGHWKREAARRSTGDILVELDHDDRLLPHALESIRRVFDQRPSVGMVYGNDAAVREDWTPNEDYNPAHGWEYREREAFGHKVRECRAAPPFPQNFCFIWYAPDHPRAYRTSDYWTAGGHDPTMSICDDQDLTCRMYLTSDIAHIDDLLYIFKVTGQNSQSQAATNAAIQEKQWGVYHTYIERMALRWAAGADLSAIDLCGAISPREGYLSVDLHKADFIADLNERWPFADNSVGVVRAADALEHLKDPIHAMNEMWRVLAHGGFAFISVPSTDGRGAYQDPTHVSRWNENSFWYYTKKAYQDYIAHAGAKCRFRRSFLTTRFPSEFHRVNNIPYVDAHLVALKDGPRFHGLQEI